MLKLKIESNYCFEEDFILFTTRQLPEECEYLAPDGSEMRELVRSKGCNMAHCVLSPGIVSLATRNHPVEELWFILSGEGQIWRRMGEVEDITDLHSGTSLLNPPGTEF